MRLYETTIHDNDNDEVLTDVIAVLETSDEVEAYNNEDYDTLFEGTGYSDAEVYFYIMPDDIPEENEGEIHEGDTYDFFTIEEIVDEL